MIVLESVSLMLFGQIYSIFIRRSSVYSVYIVLDLESCILYLYNSTLLTCVIYSHNKHRNSMFIICTAPFTCVYICTCVFTEIMLILWHLCNFCFYVCFSFLPFPLDIINWSARTLVFFELSNLGLAWLRLGSYSKKIHYRRCLQEVTYRILLWIFRNTRPWIHYRNSQRPASKRSGPQHLLCPLTDRARAQCVYSRS